MQTNRQDANKPIIFKQTDKMQTNRQDANKPTRCKQTDKMQTNRQDSTEWWILLVCCSTQSKTQRPQPIQ